MLKTQSGGRRPSLWRDPGSEEVHWRLAILFLCIMTNTETSEAKHQSLAFQPWSLREATEHDGRRDLVLRNRIVMAPMTRRFAPPTGIPTEAMIAYYRRRAAGEVGLIVSEGTGIDSVHAFDTPTVPRFETREQISGWQSIVEAIHEAGGAIAPQLWHCGRLAENPIGPSDVASDALPARRDGQPRLPVRAMVKDDFAQVGEAYVNAALQAKAIHCDALEIHGAHGYLLDSFLAATTNERTDEYGGTFENRARFPLQVVRDIRTAVGDDFPIIYRFSQWRMDDLEAQKFRTPDELELWVNALKEAGVDILHVSTRAATDPGFPEVDPRLTLAGWSRRLSGLPVIAVGKVSVTLAMDEAYGEQADAVADPGPALNLVESGEVDLLAIGRALIPNPDWVRLVRAHGWRQLTPFDKAQLATLD